MDEFDIFSLNFFIFFILTGVLIYMTFFIPITRYTIIDKSIKVDDFDIRREGFEGLRNGNY